MFVYVYIANWSAGGDLFHSLVSHDQSRALAVPSAADVRPGSTGRAEQHG